MFWYVANLLLIIEADDVCDPGVAHGRCLPHEQHHGPIRDESTPDLDLKSVIPDDQPLIVLSGDC